MAGALGSPSGSSTLQDGIGLVPVVMGLFGISEVLLNLESERRRRRSSTPDDGASPDPPGLAGVDAADPAGIGAGFLPRHPARRRRHHRLLRFLRHGEEALPAPRRFGRGAIEGVAGPEAANNAAAGGALIPLLTLGIPANAVMAILLGALMIHGLQPGPLLVTQAPDVFWGIITSMYMGNVMLLVLNLPLIRLWVRLLRVPYAILFPLILLFCLIGVYSVEQRRRRARDVGVRGRGIPAEEVRLRKVRR